MDSYDELRKEVAIKHNILLDKDDPIVMLVSLSDMVFRRHLDILMERDSAFLKAIEAAQQKGIADAKVTASRVITEGGTYLQDSARDGLMEAMKDIVAQHKKDLRAAWKEIEVAKKAAVAAAVVSCFCTAATLGVAVSVIY